MKTRRSTKLFATVAAASLVLAACGGDDDATDDPTVESTADEDTSEEMSEDDTADMSEDDTADMSEDDTAEEMSEDTAEEVSEDTGEAAPAGLGLAYGNAQEFSAYNNVLATSNSSKNTIVLTQVLPSTFNLEGPSGGLVMDESLMDAVNVLSEDPLQVEFVVNADAVWSDGDPIDCNDFYFTWKSGNGEYSQLDDEGNPVIDEDGESEIPLFAVASTVGMEDVEMVDCAGGDKTITASFSTPYSDWRALFTGMLPAHIIEAAAGADTDGSIAAFENDDRAAIDAMAEFFSTEWILNPGEIKSDIMPSGGPLIIDSWEAGSSLTLAPNENYWGTPAVGPVTIRYIAEEAQAQALANGEINAMDPQPSVDLIAQLEGADGISVETGDTYIFEHFDLNFGNEALANRQVREAFSLCLPRQQMVQNLVQPIAPDAEVVNNRLVLGFEEGYEDTSGGLSAEVDLERAQQLLDESGVAQPVELRLGWFDNGGNQRRTDQVALTIESCNQVEGFEIIDNGSETFFDTELAASDFDIAMFAWAGSPLKAGSVGQLYACEGGSNFISYCNEEVDELGRQIASAASVDEQISLSNQADALIWQDLATIPVFAFPGVAAWSDNVENVIYNPSNNGLMFNASTWQAT